MADLEALRKDAHATFAGARWQRGQK
jgi:hypothetical protein